ncbi:xanthine dehydrogenase family protein molybdopterin-binding subunit [Hymenobacter sp. GOD-10R]|uniref:xanthine dehydrogenase family protein molybdopterin-binding subunit n=1 Tax=Hymenobacter sp. GOD-10R TaxID=3093922 RepID=UPI002D767010|nr:xanthine dehydrogenase family protein molybdopterin-binding subunit [Hymenobacter sp. GOD-10R]WRQ30293.1 xanthine dehydrogenase family protein molybdopterin-binding subunit [Hymenobacter sp. GOD-10R]
MAATTYVGKPTSRVDGRAKVTGEAKYAAEFNTPGLTYGFVLSSAIAKGKIKKIDASQALSLDGVLQVFTHENAPRPSHFDRNFKDQDSVAGSPFKPLYSAEIKFSQQPIGLVVADSFEVARYAASLVKVEYEAEKPETDLRRIPKGHKAPKGKSGFTPPKDRGNADKAFKQADVQFEAEYFHMPEHHNPMEMFATTVIMEEDGKLKIYDKIQGAFNSQEYVTKVFGLSKEEARVISPFVGGGFGSGLRPQYQLYLSVMAALELKRSVRVVLTRQQMFSFGHRPGTLQTVSLGAANDGSLQAIKHEALSETSRFEEYTEVIVNWSGSLYHCDNVKLGYYLRNLDLFTPLDMRAPGAATGILATETAMDELSYKLNIDPLELRLINYAEENEFEGKPFSSKALRECYHQGAEKFGWAKRKPLPRSTREGTKLIGWGVATGMWDAQQQKAAAKANLSIDGKLVVGSGTADIGTGTYTAMTMIAAETLGLPLEDVTFKLGDTTLPQAPLQGGSWTVSSVGTAVKEACEAVGKKLLKLAKKVKDSPLSGASFEDVEFVDGKVQLKGDYASGVSIIDAMRQGEVNFIEEETTSIPNLLKQMKYARNTHSAVFVEVEVDEDLGQICVRRVVSAIAGGRVISPKTAHSQIVGGVVWGISMALHEESVLDHNLGRFMNHSLAEYHVAVNADIHDIEVIFVEEHDDIVNPLGAKGLGEIGIVGVAAAVGNAIYHATGKRVRDFPITLDKLL